MAASQATGASSEGLGGRAILTREEGCNPGENRPGGWLRYTPEALAVSLPGSRRNKDVWPTKPKDSHDECDRASWWYSGQQ